MYRLNTRHFCSKIAKHNCVTEKNLYYRSVACVKNDIVNEDHVNDQGAATLKNKWQWPENCIYFPQYRCFSCSHSNNINKSFTSLRYRSRVKEKSTLQDENVQQQDLLKKKKSGHVRKTVLPIAAQMIYGVNEHGERNKNKAVQTDDSDNDIETDNEREIDPMQRLAAEIKDAQEAVELASVEDIYQLVIILKFDEFDIIAGTQSTLT